MSEHLSALDLHEAAAGLAPPAASTHLEGCAECRAKLGELSAARAAVIADPAFRHTRARIPTPKANLRWWLASAGVTVAAVALLVLPAKLLPGTRAKGAAALSLRTGTGAEVTAPRVGDRVVLRLSAGPHRQALAVAIDGHGAAEQLWPIGTGGKSGAVAPGEHVSLGQVVTPGAARVVAAFSDEPVTLAELIAHIKRADIEYRELELRPLP